MASSEPNLCLVNSSQSADTACSKFGEADLDTVTLFTLCVINFNAQMAKYILPLRAPGFAGACVSTAETCGSLQCCSVNSGHKGRRVSTYLQLRHPRTEVVQFEKKPRLCSNDHLSFVVSNAMHYGRNTKRNF